MSSVSAEELAEVSAEIRLLKQRLEWLDDAESWYENYKLHYLPAQAGPWSIESFEIPRLSGERLLTILQEGDERDPGWGIGFTRLCKRVGKHKQVWMSDTKAEIVEHAPLIRRLEYLGNRKGVEDYSVLINGLGLGLAVSAALKNGAGQIDVVENDIDIIKLVGPKFAAHENVVIHHGDARYFKWTPNRSWSTAWHDIWPEIDGKNIPEMQYLHRKYGRRVSWQESWQRENCLAHYRHMAKERILMENLLRG